MFRRKKHIESEIPSQVVPENRVHPMLLDSTKENQMVSIILEVNGELITTLGQFDNTRDALEWAKKNRPTVGEGKRRILIRPHYPAAVEGKGKLRQEPADPGF